MCAASCIRCVDLAAVGVYLPDFHAGMFDRRALQVFDLTVNVGDLTDGPADVVVYDQQVVVPVQR
jgi:hypothetical protein